MPLQQLISLKSHIADQIFPGTTLDIRNIG